MANSKHFQLYAISEEKEIASETKFRNAEYSERRDKTYNMKKKDFEIFAKNKKLQKQRSNDFNKEIYKEPNSKKVYVVRDLSNPDLL